MARLLFPDKTVKTIKRNFDQLKPPTYLCGLRAKVTYLDEWCFDYSSGDVNKVKYPDISVTATDESIYGNLLMDKCAAAVIHNLMKERMTKMENNMTAKIALLNTFEEWAQVCSCEEFLKYLQAPCGSFMKQAALKRSQYFDEMQQVLVEIKQDLVNADWECHQQPSVICPVNIWENGDNTTVQWEDGTKTTVTAEHPESKSTFAGFCAALAKKIYGTTDKVMKQIDKAVENPKLPAKRKKEEAEQRKILRAKEHKYRVHERELRIKGQMERMYIEEEAKKRIDQAYEERTYGQPKKKAKVNKKQTPKKEAKHE